jgi:hypothetical protein
MRLPLSSTGTPMTMTSGGYSVHLACLSAASPFQYLHELHLPMIDPQKKRREPVAPQIATKRRFKLFSIPKY